MFWFDFNWQIQHFLNQFWWPINFLLLIILVVLGYLAYKKPAYAAWLTIILLPTYLFRSKIWFLPFTFLELCIWVTFLGWFFNKMSSSRGVPPGTPDRDEEAISKGIASFRNRGTRNDTKLLVYRWPILLILIASIISLLIAPDKVAAAGLWRAYFVEPILFFLVLINVGRERKSREIILWGLGISTLTISLLAISQKFTGFGIAEAGWIAASHRRVTSIFTSPNAVGLFLGPIAVIYLGWIINDLKRIHANLDKLSTVYYLLSTIKLLILALALLAILFTVSQGTWLGLLAAGLFLAYFGWRKKITIAITLTMIILTLMIPASRDKIWPILTFQDPAGQNRLTLIQMSRQYLLESPKNFILGPGIFGFSKIQNQLREPLKMEALLYPHNIILNFWLETGLLGLVGFIWLIIKFFRAGWQKLKTNSPQLALALMAAMIAILIHGLVDVPYFKNDLAILFWIIIGLI